MQKKLQFLNFSQLVKSTMSQYFKIFYVTLIAVLNVSAYKNLMCVVKDPNICEFKTYGKDVDINDVQIFGPPKVIFNVFELNGISADYIRLVFLNFTSATDMNLSKSGAANLSAGTFYNASNLQHFLADGNLIKSLEDDVFKGAFELLTLELTSNSIENLSANVFRNLLKLTTINLKNNKIAKLDPQLFVGQELLTNLDLSSNQLVDLEEGLFDKNLNLENINLKDNKIKTIFPFLWINLKQLKDLDLSYNECVDKTYKEVPKVMGEIYIDIEHCLNNNTYDNGLWYILDKYLSLRNQNHGSSSNYMWLNVVNGVFTICGLTIGITIFCKKKELLCFKPRHSYRDVHDDPMID